MRYLLEKKQIDELPYRQEYLLKTFGLFLLPKESNPSDGLIELHSIPTNNIDVLMIVAHDSTVYNYLSDCKDTIPEHTIVLVTCHIDDIKHLHIRGKRIYFSHQSKEGFSQRRRGCDYGFDFNITDSELDLYNSNAISITEKLDFAFDK